MKSGDIVMIYEDPITELKEEGEAELGELVHEARYSGDLETWCVRFKLDGFVVNRNIKTDRK